MTVWRRFGYLKAATGMFCVSFDRAWVSASNPHQLLVNMVVFGALDDGDCFFYTCAINSGRSPGWRMRRKLLGGDAVVSLTGLAVRSKCVRQAKPSVDMRARFERQIEQRTLMLSGVSHDLRTPLDAL